MRRKAQRRVLEFHPEWLEPRTLLSTLIAEIDTGVDLGDSADTPYYDLADGYNAYTQQAATSGGANLADNSWNGAHGHGSTVADSIIQGIQAMASQPGASSADVKIMPIRVTSNSGTEDGETFNAVVRGIFYAAYHHASVINISIVFEEWADDPAYVPNNPDPSYANVYPNFQDAIQYAQSKGAIVVTGAGNDHYDIDSTNPALNGYQGYNLYPTFDLASNLIVAASTDASGNLTSVSNYGPIHVDLGSQAIQNATSYAAGTISGVSGVAKALAPGLSANQLVSLVESTAQKYPQLNGLIATGAVVSPTNLVNAIFTPTVASAASAASATVSSTTDALSVLGADAAGESALTYTWSVVSGPGGVTFGPSGINGTNAAKSITATFSSTGTYVLQATISEGANRTATSQTTVNVVPKATTLSLSPAASSLTDGGSENFTATAFDQFAAPISPSPTFTWSVIPGGAGGTIDPSGKYSAPASGSGSDTVKVTTGTISQAASVAVAPAGAVAIAIASGAGSSSGQFQADTDYSGGNTYSTNQPIDTRGVANPAPQSVYQNERWTGTSFTYTVPGLTPGAASTVRLHFSENFYSGPGHRLMNVLVNGSQVLTNFDIAAAAGGSFKAVVETFNAIADASGKVSIVFVNVAGGAKVDGIEVIPAPPVVSTPPPPLPRPTVTSLGQDGHDFANVKNVVKPAPGPDGYQDVHLVLSNLPTNLAIDHVGINRQGGGGLYLSDGSPYSWTAVVQRASTGPGQYASTADVYFQNNPSVVDNHHLYDIDIYFVGLSQPVGVSTYVTDLPNLSMPS